MGACELRLRVHPGQGPGPLSVIGRLEPPGPFACRQHTSLVEPHVLRARSAASHAAAIAATAAGLQVKMWAFAREWACVAMIPSPTDDPPLLMRATAADADAGAHAPTIACSAVPFEAAVAAIAMRVHPSALQAWWCARSRAARVFSFGSCRIECSTAAGPSGTCQGQQAWAAYIRFDYHSCCS